MKKVRRLEVATGYLELYQKVDRLSAEAKGALETEPRRSLGCYTGLRSLTSRLLEVQPEAEGAAPHLVDHVQRQTGIVQEDLRQSFVKDFQATLEKMKWPQKELNMLGGTIKTWSDQAELLLELQEPDLLVKASRHDGEPQQLLPLEIMVQPLAQRFRYHFFGDRPTNRLDKPEYFLSHILDLLDRHSGLIVAAVQPVLEARLQADEELDNVYTDATSSFITALLPLVMSKGLSVLPQITSHPQLLSHFMHELMSFDDSLRETWEYRPVPGVFTDWRGLTWTILNTHGYFLTWLNVEKDFALARYKDIRDSTDAVDIDYDSLSPNDTKPTKGTIRVNDLLETITDRYRSLSSFSQKMKFLIDIQLSIFDDYHNYLHSALQTYLASSHTAGRLLQGQTRSDALGAKGLASLTKIFSSAAFLERKMSDWSDDIFFVELWEELQDRARTSTGSLGTNLHINDVAAKTSSTIRQSEDDLSDEGGALFDETAAAYRRLKQQAEGETLRLIDVNIRDAMAPFAHVDNWASLSGNTADASELAPSPAIDSVLQAISTLLGFLKKVLAPAPMRKMTMHFCATLEWEVYGSVVMRHTFSAAGVAQLRRDVLALEEAVVRVSGAGGEMRKLAQVVKLLGLGIKPSRSRSSTHMSGEKRGGDVEGWDFDEDDNHGDESWDEGNLDTTPTEEEGDEAEEREWSLWEAERALFKSNEAARQVLKSMRLDMLSEQEARAVVGRRVEIGS